MNQPRLDFNQLEDTLDRLAQQPPYPIPRYATCGPKGHAELVRAANAAMDKQQKRELRLAFACEDRLDYRVPFAPTDVVVDPLRDDHMIEIRTSDGTPIVIYDPAGERPGVSYMQAPDPPPSAAWNPIWVHRHQWGGR